MIHKEIFDLIAYYAIAFVDGNDAISLAPSLRIAFYFFAGSSLCIEY